MIVGLRACDTYTASSRPCSNVGVVDAHVDCSIVSVDETFCSVRYSDRDRSRSHSWDQQTGVISVRPTRFRERRRLTVK